MYGTKVCYCFYRCKQNDNIFYTFFEKYYQNHQKQLQNAFYWQFFLLKIECEHHHTIRCCIKRLSILEHIHVGKVCTILY